MEAKKEYIRTLMRVVAQLATTLRLERASVVKLWGGFLVMGTNQDELGRVRGSGRKGVLSSGRVAQKVVGSRRLNCNCRAIAEKVARRPVQSFRRGVLFCSFRRLVRRF